MSESWLHALQSYNYPVNLRLYCDAERYPGFFDAHVTGDRESTIAFEDHFRRLAPDYIEAYLEVVFWKMASQGGRASYRTGKIAESLWETRAQARDIWKALLSFVDAPDRPKLQQVRKQLGISAQVLPVSLTFPAFVEPKMFPMVDSYVAKWVNSNWERHNSRRENRLMPFAMNSTSLRDNDFDSYLSWVRWCREIAGLLTNETTLQWRARDVEMAVFTAQLRQLPLEILG